MGQIQLVGGNPTEQKTPPGKLHCPECRTEQPPYGFHLSGGDLGVLGIVQYFSIFCAAPVRVNTGCTRCGHQSHHPGAACPICACAEFVADETTKICGCVLGVNITQWQPPADPAQLAALQKAMRGGTPS